MLIYRFNRVMKTIKQYWKNIARNVGYTKPHRALQEKIVTEIDERNDNSSITYT